MEIQIGRGEMKRCVVKKWDEDRCGWWEDERGKQKSRRYSGVEIISPLLTHTHTHTHTTLASQGEGFSRSRMMHRQEVPTHEGATVHTAPGAAAIPHSGCSSEGITRREHTLVYVTNANITTRLTL
jgi:hypothetical protein